MYLKFYKYFLLASFNFFVYSFSNAQTSTIQLVVKNKPYQRDGLQQIGWDAQPFRIELPNKKQVWLMVLSTSQLRNYSSLTLIGKVGDSIKLKLTAVNLRRSNERKKWTDYPFTDTTFVFTFYETNKYYFISQNYFKNKKPTLNFTQVTSEKKAVRKENRRKRLYATFNTISGQLEVANWDALKPPQ